MRRSSAFPWTYLESLISGVRAAHKFAQVRTYAMFIGQPRSGTSLVGSLLNAHRNVWIAQELNALRYIRRGYGRTQLYWLLQMKDREFNENGRAWTGYDYTVPGQWQGKCEQLLVIGDKKAGLSSEQLGEQPELLIRLRQIVRVPIRMFHIVRDPMNVITTIHRKRSHTTLEQAADMYFGRCRTNWRLMQEYPDEVLTTHLEDLIAQPKRHLRQMCEFLAVDAPQDYLEACRTVLFAKPKQTKTQVPWSDSLTASVRERCDTFPFLQRYLGRASSGIAA